MVKLQEPRLKTLELSLEATKPPNMAQLWLFLLDFILQIGTVCVMGKRAPVCVFSAYQPKQKVKSLSQNLWFIPGKGSDCPFKVTQWNEEKKIGHNRLHSSHQQIRVYFSTS